MSTNPETNNEEIMEADLDLQQLSPKVGVLKSKRDSGHSLNNVDAEVAAHEPLAEEHQNGVEVEDLEDEELESSKRTRNTDSTSSTTSPSPSSRAQAYAFGISPPNFIAMEDIMKTANEMSRLAIVNEIVFNKNFKLEMTELPDGSLEKKVAETMRQAFWDILTNEVKESPPNYTQAISLLAEIKGMLLQLLMPQHTQLKTEINEILDMTLIQQQADNGIFEYQRYGQYVLSVCARLCCPVRDEMIKSLTQVTEIAPLFKFVALFCVCFQ